MRTHREHRFNQTARRRPRTSADNYTDNTAWTAPFVEYVTSTKTNGAWKAAVTIPVSVVFSEAVTVTGTPRIQLETGTTDRYATYASGTGTKTLIFNYVIQAGDTASDLNYKATDSLGLNGGTMKDAFGNNAVLTLPPLDSELALAKLKALIVDTTAPTVTNVTSTAANGYYKSGDTIAIKVIMSEPVTVTGSPLLHLETGVTDHDATYASGTGTDTLVFNYPVQAGDTSADLDYKATNSLALNSGTILDAAGNAATLTLASPGAAGSLGANRAFVIDTTAPTVANVTATNANATYTTAAVIHVQVVFSEAVTVAGGTPTLQLETGTTDRNAVYVSGTGTTTLLFDYTVIAGDASLDLDYKATNSLALAGATIKDAAGNAATLTLATPGAAGSLGANKAIVIA